MATCYRHPSRETGVSCSNCGRPICPDCMTTTAVGMRCPECSRQRTPVKTLRSTARQPEVTLALALGHLRFAAIYFISLLAGSLGALIVAPHSLTVGASGAVFGLMGAAAVEMRSRQIPVMQSGVGGLIVINLIISFTLPGISWGGHVGGLIGGALAASAIQLGNRYRSQLLALSTCLLLGACAFAGSLVAAHSSTDEGVPSTQFFEGGQ